MKRSGQPNLQAKRGMQQEEYSPLSSQQEKPFFDKDTKDTLVKIGKIALGLLVSGGVGAFTAWALTSIPPLGGALLSATPYAVLIIVLSQSDVIPNEYEGIVLLATLIATIIAVNAIGVILFPYLGMTALSIVKTSLFTTGCVALTVGVLAVMKQIKERI